MLMRRLFETAAMMVIGDSVLAIVSPRRHMMLWQEGPRWWERSVETLVRHAAATRMLGVAGLGLGIWLAWQTEPPAPDSASRRLNWMGRLREQLR